MAYRDRKIDVGCWIENGEKKSKNKTPILNLFFSQMWIWITGLEYNRIESKKKERNETKIK